MDKDKEFSHLQEAMKSDNSIQTIEKLCKQIVKERVDMYSSYDPILQEAVDDLLSELSIPIKKSTAFKKSKNEKQRNIPLATLSLLTGGFGLCLLGAKSTFIRFIGGAFCLTTGFGLKSALSPKQEQPVTSLVCASTVPELMAEIDVLYKKVLALLNHNQLEGRNKRVLLWLQRLYSDPDDDKFKREILKLVTALGYEFVEYDKAYSENFEVSDANVSEVMTTEYALRNKATGVFVLPGVVVFPKSEDK